MQAPVRTHPSDDQLRLFGIGQMDATEAAAVEEHVDSCPVCCQTLKGLASDTLIDLLRAAAVAAAAGGVTTPVQSASALSNTGEAVPVASGTDAPLRASSAPAYSARERHEASQALASSAPQASYEDSDVNDGVPPSPAVTQASGSPHRGTP